MARPIINLPLPLPLLATVGMALYALLASIMDGPAALIIGLTGLRVSPHFDRPWRATTVASFWSKRWDLAAGGCVGGRADGRRLRWAEGADGGCVG